MNSGKNQPLYHGVLHDGYCCGYYHGYCHGGWRDGFYLFADSHGGDSTCRMIDKRIASIRWLAHIVP